jgi:hypothetical protein
MTSTAIATLTNHQFALVQRFQQADADYQKSLAVDRKAHADGCRRLPRKVVQAPTAAPALGGEVLTPA